MELYYHVLLRPFFQMVLVHQMVFQESKNLDFLLPSGEHIDDVLAGRGDLAGALLEWEKENNMDGDFDDSDDIDGDY